MERVASSHPPVSASVPASAPTLNIGPALSRRSPTGLSDRGASHAPPPTPAALPHSPLPPLASPALRDRTEQLAALDAALAAAQLRATNDAMLRPLLHSLPRDAVEAALTFFAKRRAEAETLETEQALAEEVRRLQDGVTTAYIARATEGDLGIRERQVPEDLSHRMEDLEEQSANAADAVLGRADGELEALANVVGVQGDPHNSADLDIAKHVQATMQTLRVVRDERAAIEKRRLTKAAAAAVAHAPAHPPQQLHYLPASQQLQNPPPPTAAENARHSETPSAYEQRYPAPPAAERPLWETGYETRAQPPADDLYPGRDAVHTAPFPAQKHRPDPAASAAELYPQPGAVPVAAPYPAPSSYPELTAQPAPASMPAPTPPQYGPPPRDGSAERLASRASFPAPTSHSMPLPNPVQEGQLPRNDTAEQPAGRTSYPASASNSVPFLPQPGLKPCEETAERLTSGGHVSQNVRANGPRYPVSASLEPALPAHAYSWRDNRDARYAHQRGGAIYPSEEQRNEVRVPPAQKPDSQAPGIQLHAEHANTASQVRPEFPGTAAHRPPPCSTTTPSLPEPYQTPDGYSGYQHFDEPHRPLHTSDPPGFQQPEVSSSYSHLPQPPSPDVRTPPPEYASGRPHSLSHQDYPYAAPPPGLPPASSMYPAEHGQNSLLPQYPPGVFTAPTAGPEPARYPRNPDVYQPPRPEELSARPSYANGGPSPRQQPYPYPNMYPAPPPQGSQPSLFSRHSTPAYAVGYSGPSQQQYSVHSYPQPAQHGSQQLQTQTNAFNAAHGYGGNQYMDPSFPKRASSHIGTGYYGSQPPGYGANRPAPGGSFYGRGQQPHDPRLLNPSQNHSTLPSGQSAPSHGQPSYPQRRTSYIDSNLRIPAGPQQQGYTSSGYSALENLQDVTKRQQMQANMSLGNSMYNTGLPQPPAYGAPSGGVAQPVLPGMIPQGPSMMGPPGLVGGISSGPPVPGVAGVSAMGPQEGAVPQGAGHYGPYPPVGPAIGHRPPGPSIPGNNPELTAASLDGVIHSFQRL